MKFKKAILRAGDYLATGADGSRVPSKFTEDRLIRMSNTSNSMIEAGLRIPGPFSHNKAAVPKLSTDTQPDPYINAGYWEKFWVESDNGVPTLFGIIDADGTTEDYNTPAGKIGKSVKECSVSLRPEFMDGKNRLWKDDPIIHVALCTHPVDYSTGDFELADSADLSVSLSSHVGEADISTLRTKLKDVANIHLPESCDPKNLVTYLLASLGQLELSKKETKDDDDFVIEPSPVFLSTEVDMPFDQKQAEALVSANVQNPATGKPYTMADLGFGKKQESKVDPNIDQLLSFSKAVTAKLVADQKSTLTRRINSLIEAKKITKEYADTSLFPQVAEISLSFQNNEIQVPQVERVIEALENIPMPKATPAPTNHSSVPSDGTVHVPEADDKTELTDDEANKLADEMLSFL